MQETGPAHRERRREDGPSSAELDCCRWQCCRLREQWCPSPSGPSWPTSNKDRASRFRAPTGCSRVSIVCQDSFFKGGEQSSWDIPEALDHDLILKHLKNECENADLDCVIFEGFKAFHDPRVVELLHVRIWLDVPREVARKRRLARNKRWTAEHFDKQIWANHFIYKKDVNERLGSTMHCFSGVDKVIGCRRNLWCRQDAAPFASIASVVVDAARMQDPW